MYVYTQSMYDQQTYRVYKKERQINETIERTYTDLIAKHFNIANKYLFIAPLSTK